jgi:hypothetical protein
LALPIGWPTYLVFLALVTGTLWWFSYPTAGGMGLFVVLSVGWEAVAVFYVVRVIGTIGTSGLRSLRERWVRWIVPVVITAAGIPLVFLNVPLEARFAVSRGALENFAEETKPFSNVNAPRRAGLYRIYSFEEFRDGVRFRVSGAGFVNTGGFAYVEGDALADRGPHEYWHIGGPWYVWEWEF